MKRWNFLTPFGVVLGVLYLNLAHCESVYAAPLSSSVYFECERALKSLSHSRETIEVFGWLDRLDQINPETHADLRRNIDQITDLALEGKELELIRQNAWALLKQLEAEHLDRSPATAHDEGPIELNPDFIQPGTVYPHPRAPVKGIVFSAESVKELKDLAPETREKLIRGLLKGFVAPLSGPGIVRTTDVHPRFFEIKAAKSVERLLGCLEDGFLVIKKSYFKRNGGRGGALQSYAYLCGD